MRTASIIWAIVCLPISLAAQAPSDAALVSALRLVTEGRGDSARALVRERLRSLSPADSAYAEALFVAGAVAETFDSAVMYFRRVALDYPRSSWADDALLRVAQLSFASGDLENADRSIERIRRDYPFSDVRPAASYWKARVLLEQDSLAAACGVLREAQVEAEGDVELANRVRFYLQRCAAVAAVPAAGDSATVPTGGAGFTVQVAAVRTASAADEVMRMLRRAGYDSRVVRDADGLLKVRVGRYRTRAEAQRAQEEIRGRIGGRPFVVEES